MTDPVRDLARGIESLAEKLGNGISIAAWVDGAERTAGSDEVLRPGSITKVVTAIAVLQCVDDGLIGLDDLVRRWVPFLDARITVRHLLSHSSGLDAGDLFVDTGDGDDSLERYLELLADARQLFPPGHTFSYCNGGMIIAGHVAALVRGMTYEEVVPTHVFARAGMTSARFEPERNGNPICARALAPAGGTLACTALDLVRLATAPLVTAQTRAAMATRQVCALGGVAQMTGCGLGWQVWENEHGRTLRHGGAYPGHSAVLVVDPATDTALALMMPLAAGINAINRLLDDRDVRPRDEPPASLERYVGEYASHAMRVVVDHRDDGGLQLTVGSHPAMAIEPVDRSTFLVFGEPFAFFDFDDTGAPRYLRWRMRVQRRI